MRRFAQDTVVPISRTRGEIDRLLRDWGADQIQWHDDYGRDVVHLRFAWKPPGKRDGLSFLARFTVKLPGRVELEPQAIDGRSGRPSQIKLSKLMEARGKREMRLLLLWLRGALNAVDAGIVSAEAIFLPFLEGQDGRTVAEAVAGRLGVIVADAGRLLPEAMEP